MVQIPLAYLQALPSSFRELKQAHLSDTFTVRNEEK